MLSSLKSVRVAILLVVFWCFKNIWNQLVVTSLVDTILIIQQQFDFPVLYERLTIRYHFLNCSSYYENKSNTENYECFAPQNDLNRMCILIIFRHRYFHPIPMIRLRCFRQKENRR